MVKKSPHRTKRKTKKAPSQPLKVDPAQSADGNGASTSNRELLRRLYGSLLKYRMLNERAESLIAGCASTADYDAAIGHEAIVAGATLELGPEDTIVTPTRGFGAQIAKAIRLPVTINKNGDRVGTATAEVGLMGSLNPFNLGTGIALAHRLGKTRNVVIALCVDRSSTPDFGHEAMKFAGERKLPIIYVLRCRSAFETGAATGKPALEEISFTARDCGFPAVIVDGRDAVAVWRVAQESIHRARNGGGPTLIECETRFTQSEDALAHLEHYMRKRGVWDVGWRRELMDGIEAEIRMNPAQD